MFSWFHKTEGTFRPIKNVPAAQKYPKMRIIWQQTIVTDASQGCKLPPGENLNEWIAVSTIDFFNEVSYYYQTISEFCTIETCPEMAAGPGFKYAWQDNDQFKKPTVLPACEYIAYCMQWVESLINDEKIFVEEGSNKSFPKDFMNINKKIYQRLFRVYAHMYHHHLDDLKRCRISDNMNRSFKNFMAFTKEFKMIPDDQLVPLKTIIEQL